MATPRDTDTPHGLPSFKDHGSGPHLRALELLNDWCIWLRDVRGRAPGTIAIYADAVDAWIEWCAETGLCKPLTPTQEDLEAFTTRPRKRQGRGRTGAPATIRREVVTLKGWYTWMRNRGHIGVLPYMDDEWVGPSVRQKRPRPIPEDHWIKFWSAKMPVTLRVGYGLCYYAGLRRKEACTTESRHLLLEARVVDFVGKSQDEEAIEWGLMLDVVTQELPHLASEEPVAQWLEGMEYLKRRNSSGLLIGYSDPQTLYKLGVKHCQRLGLPSYSPHRCRDSCATNLLNAGLDQDVVMRLMRHSSIDMTLAYGGRGAASVRKWLQRGG